MSKDINNISTPSYEDKMAHILAESQTNDYDSEYQFIELNLNSINKLSIDKKLFKKGIDSVSEICGAICALSNVGVSPESAMVYIASKYETDTTYKMQIDLSKDINETNVKVAELSGEMQMKNQI